MEIHMTYLIAKKKKSSFVKNQNQLITFEQNRDSSIVLCTDLFYFITKNSNNNSASQANTVLHLHCTEKVF